MTKPAAVSAAALAFGSIARTPSTFAQTTSIPHHFSQRVSKWLTPQFTRYQSRRPGRTSCARTRRGLRESGIKRCIVARLRFALLVLKWRLICSQERVRRQPRGHSFFAKNSVYSQGKPIENSNTPWCTIRNHASTLRRLDQSNKKRLTTAALHNVFWFRLRGREFTVLTTSGG